MIYTCYEMIRDCRAGRAEGWRYFIAGYVPVIRKLLAHYQAGGPVDEAALERVLAAVRHPESSLFQSLEPAPERWFVAQLRQKVMEELPAPAPAAALDLETVAAALDPLTLVEKQAAWLETMLYPAAETGVLLRMAPATVEKIRAKAADLVRGKADSWSRTSLAENGRALGRAAAAAADRRVSSAEDFPRYAGRPHHLAGARDVGAARDALLALHRPLLPAGGSGGVFAPQPAADGCGGRAVPQTAARCGRKAAGVETVAGQPGVSVCQEITAPVRQDRSESGSEPRP